MEVMKIKKIQIKMAKTKKEIEEQVAKIINERKDLNELEVFELISMCKLSYDKESFLEDVPSFVELFDSYKRNQTVNNKEIFMKIKDLSIDEAFIEDHEDILEVPFNKKSFKEYYDKTGIEIEVLVKQSLFYVCFSKNGIGEAPKSENRIYLNEDQESYDLSFIFLEE